MAIVAMTAWCLSLITLLSMSVDLEISHIYSTQHFKSSLLKNRLLFQESISVLSVTLFIMHIYMRNKNAFSVNLFTITSLFILAKVIFVFCSFSFLNIAIIMIFFAMLWSIILLEVAFLLIWPIIVNKRKFSNSLFVPSFLLITILAQVALWLGFQILKNEDPIVFNCILIPNVLLAAYIVKNYKEIIDSQEYSIQENDEIKIGFSPSMLSFIVIVNFATVTPIRYFNNDQDQNYSGLGNSIALTTSILGIQLAVPFILKNCLPNKILTCSGVALLIISYSATWFESETAMLNSLLFNVSLNIITFAIVPVKSWNLIDYEKILVNKIFAKVFTIAYIIMGMLKTLVVFNLLLTDLDVIIRVIITLTSLICTGTIIFMMGFSKMLNKVAQVLPIELV